MSQVGMRGDVAYLDYAATAAIRPPEVADAMADYLRDVGATPGRGGHRAAVQAGRVALECRQRLARLLGIPGDPGRIAFMLNATHALNTALAGVLRRGDVAVRTRLDHNAVRRPLHRLAAERELEVRIAPASAAGELDPSTLERLLDGARLLVLNGGSNVLGTVPQLAELTARAHAAGALVLLDAAQSAGHVPMDIAALGVDLVALTGHKGLLGPQGVGALWVRPGLDIEPLLVGGSGGDSAAADMPSPYPDRLEAGTQNAPGIAGLAAGAAWLERQGIAALHARLAALAAALRDRLLELERVRVLSPAGAALPIVSVVIDGMDAGLAAERLDREYGVLTRSGLHCAPDTHALLGTERTGAIRFSLGWASTEDDVERAAAAVHGVAARGAPELRRPRMRGRAHDAEKSTVAHGKGS